MPKLQLTKAEADALKRRRANNAKFNAGVDACLKRVKARMKGADPLASAVLNQVVTDLRKVLRV